MRLIDADAFIEENKEIIDCEIDHPKYQDTLRELIDQAPTIKTFTLADIEEQYRKGLEKGLEERPHGEWIPVSERLPEEDEDIIITHLGNMKKPIVDVSYFDGDFRSEDGEAYFSEVIAWMPLPEPYTRGEAE